MLREMSAAEDLNALLSGSVDVATDLLAEQSEFTPFALAMRDDDAELIHLEPETPEDDTDAVLGALQEGLREGALAGRYRATAIVSDVTLEDDEGESVSSAILVAMEHAQDEPVQVIIPYSINQSEVELGELAAEPGERVVFVADDSEPPN
jgi:hypothetical protein